MLWLGLLLWFVGVVTDSFSCSPTLVFNISTAIALIAIQFCTDICVPQMINPDRWSPDIFTLRTSQSTFVIADQMSAKLYDIPNCLLASANLPQIKHWLFYIAASQFYKWHHSDLHISMCFPLSLLHLFSVYLVVYENQLPETRTFTDSMTGADQILYSVREIKKAAPRQSLRPSSGIYVLPDWSDRQCDYLARYLWYFWKHRLTLKICPLHKNQTNVN